MAPRAIVIVLDSVGVGALPDAAAYGDEGSDTLGHVAAAGPLRIPTLAGARPVARRHAARRAGGRRAARGVRPDGRALAGQGLGHRPLGADRAGPRPPVPDLSARVSGRARRRLRRPHRPARPRQRRRLGHGHHRRARARRISGPASRSSTPRPTASSRSPRTKRWCPVRQLYAWCRDRLRARGRGRRPRPGHRPALRRRARRATCGRPTVTTSRCRRRARRCSIG